MTTVAQLIAHLQTLPQEAIVQCLSANELSWSTTVEWIDLNIDDDINVIDLRGSIQIKPEDKNYNKVFVEIGSK